METYVSAQELSGQVKALLAAGRLAKGEFPTDRTGIDRRCTKAGVPFQEEKARGGRGGVTRLYLVSAIPGLPPAVRDIYGASAVSKAGQAGAKSARQHKEELHRTAEEDRIHKEHCLAKFSALPEERQRAAQAKFAVLAACGLFLKGGGYKGRRKDGRETWNTAGVERFVERVKADKTLLEAWVYAELQRRGEVSLGYRTVITWRDNYVKDGLYGLADQYISKMTTSLTAEQRKFVVACICDHPMITAKKLLAAVEARFSGLEIPSIWAINRYVIKWKRENAERYLFLTNPDAWKNKYMFAIGDASESIVALNQRWEADSTPGDIMLTDGRHAIIGVIDVYSRRPRVLVTPTSRSASIAALLRRCLLEWGVPAVLKTDNGKDYTAIYIITLLDHLDVDHQLCHLFCPEEKPHIERFLQTLSHGIMELLPGYIGHSVTDRKAIEARQSFAKKLMTKGETVDVKMTSDQLQKVLDDWIDAMYMHDAHGGLDGMTPAQVVQAWAAPVKRITNERALDVLLMPAADGGGYRTIGKEGVSVTHGAAILKYWAPEFAGRSGEKVRVCPDLTDLGRATISLQTGEFLCWAEDPTWYGISRAEAGAHLRAKQRKVMSEGVKELKKECKVLKTRGIAFEVLEHRKALLREKSENVVELPRRAIDYTTPALDEAARAVDARDMPPKAKSEATPEILEMKEKIRREMERAKVLNVPSIQVESRNARYERMKALRHALSEGLDVSTEDYEKLRNYESSAEYKVMRDMEETRKALI